MLPGPSFFTPTYTNLFRDGDGKYMLMETIQEMAQEKCKLGTGDPKSAKKTPQKRARLAIASKRPVIIGSLLPSVVCLSTTP